MKKKIGISAGIVFAAASFGFVLQAAGYFTPHPKLTANMVLSQELQASNPQLLMQDGAASMAAAISSGIAARDTQRVNDVKQLQADLQLYYNKCGYYPGVAQPGSSCGLFAADGGSYARVSAALIGSNLGIASVPNDPTAGVNYFYGTNVAGTSYTIGAQLEDLSNSALQQSLNGWNNGVGCGQASGVYCMKL